MTPQKSEIYNEIKGVIKDMSFITKKTYRIALALTVISKCLLESDPFHQSLRETSQKLLSLTATFHKKSILQKELAFGQIEDLLLSTEKTLLALWSAGDISEQNYRILKSSINSVLGLVQESTLPFQESVLQSSGVGPQSRMILDKEWLEGEERGMQKENQKTRPNINDMVSDRIPVQQKVSQKSASKRHISEEKSERIDTILDFIKDKKEVSVKDIMSVIEGVASKTVQRDLQHLIDNGQVKKIGAKRWAKYVYLR